jgi:hypothetical protein
MSEDIIKNKKDNFSYECDRIKELSQLFSSIMRDPKISEECKLSLTVPVGISYFNYVMDKNSELIMNNNYKQDKELYNNLIKSLSDNE